MRVEHCLEASTREASVDSTKGTQENIASFVQSIEDNSLRAFMAARVSKIRELGEAKGPIRGKLRQSLMDEIAEIIKKGPPGESDANS